MDETEREIDAPPEAVWEVLADGWLYPLWVVGASRMREVDAPWPKEGACLHHSVGTWPALIDDTTTSLECQPPSLLRVRARAWPAGEAEVRITVEARGSGSMVRIAEDAAAGPGRLIPPPVRRALLHWRNTETLRRLAFLAERRQRRAG